MAQYMQGEEKPQLHPSIFSETAKSQLTIVTLKQVA